MTGADAGQRRDRSPPPLWGRVREGGSPVAISDPQKMRARQLRQRMTGAQRRLWSCLRAHRLHGLPFRRQAVIGPFVVDFVSHQARLIVELDDRPGTADMQRRRDQWLRDQGYTVLRFTDHEVLSGTGRVLDRISRGATPLPSPPPQGGRGPVAPGDQLGDME